MSIGCSSTSKVCPQNNKTIDCACVEQLTDGTQSCSSQQDCRTYGCEIHNVCIINNQQWKCSRILSPYACNNTECYNNGKCISHEKYFICDCNRGFSGTFCEKLKKPNQILILIATILFLLSFLYW